MTAGATEIFCEYGSDFAILPNGDLQLAQNTTDSTDATTQRIIRLVMTSPRLFINGQYVTFPDDLFNPDWGSGQPQLVGKPISVIIPALTAQINKALANDPTIAPYPAPTVTITQANNNTVNVSIQCTAVNGNPVAVSIPIPTS